MKEEGGYEERNEMADSRSIGIHLCGLLMVCTIDPSYTKEERENDYQETTSNVRKSEESSIIHNISSKSSVKPASYRGTSEWVEDDGS